MLTASGETVDVPVFHHHEFTEDPWISILDMIHSSIDDYYVPPDARTFDLKKYLVFYLWTLHWVTMTAKPLHLLTPAEGRYERQINSLTESIANRRVFFI